MDLPAQGGDPVSQRGDHQLEHELLDLDGRFAAGDLSEALISRWGEVLAQRRARAGDGLAAGRPPRSRARWGRTG